MRAHPAASHPPLPASFEGWVYSCPRRSRRVRDDKACTWPLKNCMREITTTTEGKCSLSCSASRGRLRASRQASTPPTSHTAPQTRPCAHAHAHSCPRTLAHCERLLSVVLFCCLQALCAKFRELMSDQGAYPRLLFELRFTAPFVFAKHVRGCFRFSMPCARGLSHEGSESAQYVP